MLKQGLLNDLNSSQQFFNRSTKLLTAEQETFVPAEGMFSAAQQVAHAAQTIDWFIEGGWGKGFDMDFERHGAEARAVTSLKDARDWLDRAYAAARRRVEQATDEELTAALPQGPIMGGAPRTSVIGAIVEHTAHHRGALSVYTRLCGQVPPMPYMDAS